MCAEKVPTDGQTAFRPYIVDVCVCVCPQGHK